MVLETDSTGAQTARNIYGDNLLSRTVQGQTLNYMYNGHGDVTALTDATTGTVEAAYYYDAFGNVVNALKHGDVNGDGVITSTDYAWVLRYCLDMTTEFPSPFGKLAADVDGDNNITDTDASYIEENILGMIEYFPADTNKDCYTDSKNPYGYAGYQYDRETGLYYLNVRMYDPVTARFLQEDTYMGNKNDPLSLNLYTYCHNEPIMYTDPLGHDATLISYNGQTYSLYELDRRKHWDEFDNIDYTTRNYKYSNEQQKLTDFGKFIYQNKEKVNIRDLRDYYGVTGWNTAEIVALNKDLKDYARAVNEYNAYKAGKIKLNDNQIEEDLKRINLGYAYFSGIYGIDFDENYNPIENENLYFAYGVRTAHALDFSNSMYNSDVGAGFEGVAQRFRQMQMDTGIIGGMNFKSSLNSGPRVPTEVDASISKLDYIERNGVKPNPTNYIKPTIVERYEEQGKRKVTLNKNFTGKFTARENTGWNMQRGGGVINGRRYSEHALERMAPDTAEVRAEIHTRAMERAKAAGLTPGTKEYSDFINKQIDPRGIPPTVVEDAINNTQSTPGKYKDTYVHENSNVTVIVNKVGDVVTVIPR